MFFALNQLIVSLGTTVFTEGVKRTFQKSDKLKKEVKKELIRILSHKTHAVRSFKTIRKRIPFYSDEELRKFLFEINARTTKMQNSEEGWYLLKRKKQVYAYNKSKIK